MEDLYQCMFVQKPTSTGCLQLEQQAAEMRSCVQVVQRCLMAHDHSWNTLYALS